MKNNTIERVKVAMGRAHATISDACGIDRRFSKNLLSVQQATESVAGLIISNCRKKVYTIH